MKRVMAIIVAVFSFLAVGVLLGAPAAWAHERTAYMTVAWTMPSWDDTNATWPQTYYVSEETGAPDLNVLDSKLTDCSQWQVDVYKYSTDWQRKNVDALIAAGVLTAPNKPYPEPLVSYKFVKGEPCQSESPTPTPSESVTPTPSLTPTPSESITPTPTPSDSSPTPSSTPSDSVTPTPTPTPTGSHPPVHSSPPSSSPPPELPHTGAGTVLGLAGFGALLILGGSYLVWTWRKP